MHVGVLCETIPAISFFFFRDNAIETLSTLSNRRFVARARARQRVCCARALGTFISRARKSRARARALSPPTFFPPLARNRIWCSRAMYLRFEWPSVLLLLLLLLLLLKETHVSFGSLALEYRASANVRLFVRAKVISRDGRVGSRRMIHPLITLTIYRRPSFCARDAYMSLSGVSDRPVIRF